MAVGIAIGAALYDKIGARGPGIAGFIITLYAGYLMCHITPDTSRSQLAWLTALRGFGYALAVIPIMTAGLASIPAVKLDGASAFMNLVWRVSGALFVGILNSIATIKGAQFMADLSGTLGARVASGNYPADAVRNQNARAMLPLYEQLQLHVQAHVVSNLFIVMAATTAIGLLLSLTLRGGKPATDHPNSQVEMAL